MIFYTSLLLLAGIAAAQVSVISVTDEAQYKKKEEFSHTFEYFIRPDNPQFKPGKCQATRITRRWFATAAHCVQSCQKGCTIEMDLLEYPVSARARVQHTAQKPAVFANPDFSYNVFVKNDFALIRLDLDHTPLLYYNRGNDQIPPFALTRQQFMNFLEHNRKASSAFRRVQSPSFPPLLVFDDGNYLLERELSVISIFDGQRNVRQTSHPVHYVKELGFAFTEDFGIVHGMSGSGVMSNTGELVGIISGILQKTQITPTPSQQQTEFQKTFMFFAFNQAAVEFMKNVMGSDFYKLDLKDAYPGYVSKSRKNYKEIIDGIRHINLPPKTPKPAAKSPRVK